MTHYLVQIDYTAEAWQAMVKNPGDRLEKVQPVVEDSAAIMSSCGSRPATAR
jgi:hypothetical protein